MLQRFINAPATFWALLALPSIPMIAALISGAPSEDGRPPTEFLLHPTGEFAARFMILAMVVTPMQMVLPSSAFWRWMTPRRRYLGVAAFAYAALHTALYVVDLGSLRLIMGEFFDLGIWTGWLAFLIFLPLAVTSNDAAIRALGSWWKPLQRWVYVAAVSTLLHWIFIHNTVGPALVHFLPLAALECFRIWRNLTPRRATPLG